MKTARVLATILLWLPTAAMPQAATPASTQYRPYYLPAVRPNYAAAIGTPPPAGSSAALQDMDAVRQAEKERTAADVQQAQQDDSQEDIFLYSTVLGPSFQASLLPKLAALSAHLRNDVGVVNPPLKAYYNRPRPFLANLALSPVCEKKQEGSFPSGHAAVGYVTGLVLAQMLPERASAILARAHEYAQHRIVCGVHYPSDLEASRALALILLGEFTASTRFREDFREAQSELRRNHCCNRL